MPEVIRVAANSVAASSKQGIKLQRTDVAKNIQAIRGMNDYLPADTAIWQRIESILKQVLAGYGYSEIRMPIVEQTPLFKRAIGEVTDVVEKEMYTFDDRNGESLTLRPEGTAGCVRAGIEHGLLYNQEQRLWYIGPMFRYERPQKGRYRQFHQLGAEVFGLGPDIDAELILLTARWWRALGISEHVQLELNSIGSLDARADYREALVTLWNNMLRCWTKIVSVGCTVIRCEYWIPKIPMFNCYLMMRLSYLSIWMKSQNNILQVCVNF